MNNETQQLIKRRLQELPKELQAAIRDPGLSAKFETISNRHNLLLDQGGSLYTETILVMLGLEPSSGYVDNLEKELEVSHAEAMAIAEDVNSTILVTIRDAIRKVEEEQEQAEEKEEQKETQPNPAWMNQASTPTPPAAPIEKAGDFKIIPPPVSNSPQYEHENLDKDAVLHDLENIEKLQPKKANDFVEHLLANPVSNPQQTEVKKPTPPPAAGRQGPDPYREQF
jgi:hypothetical protein